MVVNRSKVLSLLCLLASFSFALSGLGTSLRGLVSKVPVPNIFKSGGFERTRAELKDGIANFYDESSGVWLDVWGEHMHHGYYPHKSYKNHTAAQLDMIDRSLAFAYGNDEARPESVVDIGCGVGGSSRHIARKYDSIKKARGISLSPFQVARANSFTQEQNLANLVEYKVDDAMASSFADNEFDLTWSMESGEHMPDKEQFVKELVRLTSPGGRIIVVTWCHRELVQGEDALSEKETKLLQKINEAYFLPAWVPSSSYVTLMKEQKLEDVRSDDWSEYVMPFWPAVFKSALVPRNFLRMVRSGRTTVKGAWAGLWMLQGFATGTIKFALITGRKPQAL